MEKSISDTSIKVSGANLNPTDSILGEWKLCAIKSDKNVTNYNICPIIIFMNDGVGKRINLPNEEEIFFWEVLADTIYLSYNVTARDKTFSEDKYNWKFERKNDYLELQLISRKKYSYILGRSLKN